MAVFIDFETRSRVDLRKHGLERYARDCDTVTLCLAYAIGEEEVQLWAPGDGLPLDLFEATRGNHVYAHNAGFERAIWLHHCVGRLGWPEIDDEQWRCSAALAAYWGLPRKLEEAAIALGLVNQKQMEGHRMMLKYTKPRTVTASDSREWHDDPDELRTIHEYCMSDVLASREIVHMLGPLPPTEQKLFALDAEINQTGIPVDVRSISRLIQNNKTYTDRLHTRLSELTGGQVTTAYQLDRMIQWLNQNGVNLGDLKKDTVDRLLQCEDLSQAAWEVLWIRAELSRSSTKKYQAFYDRAYGGRIHHQHLYFGAGTGRWTGREIQPQNLPRGGLDPEEIDDALAASLHDFELSHVLYGSATEVLSSLVRPMICASPEHQLIACDFASIEARVLAWLAGERGLARDFALKKDIYREFAARIYEVDPKDVTSEQRRMGKQAILGLGYGMGWQTFQRTCAQYQIEVDEDFSNRVVDLYRATYPMIRSFWKALNRAAIECVKTKADQRVEGTARVSFSYKFQWLQMCLPSGRAINYFQPTVRKVVKFETPMTELSYMGRTLGYQWKRLSTYGGKLCENLVQGVARDVLGAAMLRLKHTMDGDLDDPDNESKGKIIMHVHDEAVIETPVVKGLGMTPKQIERLMSIPPDWAKGLPLAAEAFAAPRYRK